MNVALFYKTVGGRIVILLLLLLYSSGVRIGEFGLATDWFIVVLLKTICARKIRRSWMFVKMFE